MRRLLFQENFGTNTSTNGLWERSESQFTLSTNTGGNYESAKRAAGTTDGEGFLTYQNQTPSPDVIAQATFSTTSKFVFQIGIRGGSESADFNSLQGAYFLVSRSSNASVGSAVMSENKAFIVDRASNHAITKRASVGVSLNTSAHVLRFEAKGTTYLAYIDGSLAMSAATSSHTGPGYVRVGLAGNTNGPAAYIKDVQIVENRNQAGHAAFAAFDESRGDIYFNLGNGVQYVYDTSLDEWYRRDLNAVGLGMILDAKGEKRMVLGTTDGYVNALDASTDYGGTNFTGTWTSNWFDLGDDETRKRLTRLLVELTKETTNTTARLRLERAEHPDLPSQEQEWALNTIAPQNMLSPRLGGRFVRFTVIHTAAGDIEIHQIKSEMMRGRPANRGALKA